MVDVDRLSEAAAAVGVNFTGFLTHQHVTELAQAWMPDVNFHEVEEFHSIDLADLYSVPAEAFADFSLEERDEFAVEVGGVPMSPPIIRIGDQGFGAGPAARSALEDPEIDHDAVYSHGGTLRAAEKFFGSLTDVPGRGNPSLPRFPLRVRAEFRMLLDNLKFDLELESTGLPKPLDAIWGDFDVTDILLRQVDPNPRHTRDHPASGPVRRDYARSLIREFEAGNLSRVDELLNSPPPDGDRETLANKSAWDALSKCGFMEYHFVYAYNDFARFGGFFTNEHEGDNEGCCVVFERERLATLADGSADAQSIAPMALVTSVHEEGDKADELRQVDASDAGDAREGLDVYVARGSHATYLDPGTHDFLEIPNAIAKKPELFSLASLLAPAESATLVILFMIYEHFAPDPDVTSAEGSTGQANVDPDSDPETHLPVDLTVTPLSDLNNPDDVNIYDPTREGGVAELALRAFQGRIGNHDGFFDKSPKWQNKTRRYFVRLVDALEAGEIPQPLRVVVE